jgi:hypothetical protein
MAETGQIKIFGDHPTRVEAALAKTRRHLYKEERLTYNFTAQELFDMNYFLLFNTVVACLLILLTFACNKQVRSRAKETRRNRANSILLRVG